MIYVTHSNAVAAFMTPEPSEVISQRLRMLAAAEILCKASLQDIDAAFASTESSPPGVLAPWLNRDIQVQSAVAQEPHANTNDQTVTQSFQVSVTDGKHSDVFLIEFENVEESQPNVSITSAAAGLMVVLNEIEDVGPELCAEEVWATHFSQFDHPDDLFAEIAWGRLAEPGITCHRSHINVEDPASFADPETQKSFQYASLLGDLLTRYVGPECGTEAILGRFHGKLDTLRSLHPGEFSGRDFMHNVQSDLKAFPLREGYIWNDKNPGRYDFLRELGLQPDQAAELFVDQLLMSSPRHSGNDFLPQPDIENFLSEASRDGLDLARYVDSQRIDNWLERAPNAVTAPARNQIRAALLSQRSDAAQPKITSRKSVSL